MNCRLGLPGIIILQIILLIWLHNNQESSLPKRRVGTRGTKTEPFPPTALYITTLRTGGQGEGHLGAVGHGDEKLLPVLAMHQHSSSGCSSYVISLPSTKDRSDLMSSRYPVGGNGAGNQSTTYPSSMIRKQGETSGRT